MKAKVPSRPVHTLDQNSVSTSRRDCTVARYARPDVIATKIVATVTGIAAAAAVARSGSRSPSAIAGTAMTLNDVETRATHDTIDSKNRLRPRSTARSSRPLSSSALKAGPRSACAKPSRSSRRAARTANPIGANASPAANVANASRVPSSVDTPSEVVSTAVP